MRMRIRFYVIRQIPDFWKHIFSICIIRERKRGLTSGGSTGNRGKFAGMKDWIHSGFLIIFISWTLQERGKDL